MHASIQKYNKDEMKFQAILKLTETLLIGTCLNKKVFADHKYFLLMILKPLVVASE